MLSIRGKRGKERQRIANEGTERKEEGMMKREKERTGMLKSRDHGGKSVASSLSSSTNQTQQGRQLIFLASEQKDSFHASNPRAAMPLLPPAHLL